MKKIVFLFAGAAALFLLLSFIDEYENLILPLLSTTKVERPSSAVDSGQADDVARAIRNFNDLLAEAYLTSDSSTLLEHPIDRKLITSLTEEISYMKREGKIMDLHVEKINIDSIRPVSPVLLHVKTRETVRLRYLIRSDLKHEGSYNTAIYYMKYTLEGVEKGWKILSVETVAVEDKR